MTTPTEPTWRSLVSSSRPLLVDWISQGTWIGGVYVVVHDLHLLEPRDDDDSD